MQPTIDPERETGMAVPPPAEWPRAKIGNGVVEALIALPDAEVGFYRASRFEHGGMIHSLWCHGHCYFAPYGEPHDSGFHDHASGTAAEFAEPPGYDEAAPGEPFLKLGVGVLRRSTRHPYLFSRDYEVVQRFPWEVQLGDSEASFQQTGAGPGGRAYRYEKRLILPPGEAALRIEHRLVNTGAQRLATHHYCHNFVLIDGHPGGPDYEVEFGWEPVVENPLFPLTQSGNRYRCQAETYFSLLAGCDSVAANVARIRHLPSDTVMTMRGDFVPARYGFFGNVRTICPEPFFAIDVAPGEATTWSTGYTFGDTPTTGD